MGDQIAMIADPQKFPTWGYPQSQWDAAKEEGRSEMIRTARRRSTITYSELAGVIKAISFQPDEKPFHNLLGQISIEEERAGRGMLSVVVVHRSDHRPGQGFFELAHDLDHDVRDREKFWADELQRIYDAWPRQK
jgi:hypothetical protein